MFKRKKKYIDEHYQLPVITQILISIICVGMFILGALALCNLDERNNNVDYIEIVK